MHRATILPAALLAATGVAGSTAGLASETRRVAEPTALESFIAEPNVAIGFRELVGSIASSDATLAVAAIVAEGRADPTRRMRGIELALQDNTGVDRVYLDESLLATVQRDLEWIEKGIPGLDANTDAVWRVHGTESCWMPERPQRILCPSYVVGPEGSRLTLAAYGAETFAFPARRPAELAALVERAIEAFSAR